MLMRTLKKWTANPYYRAMMVVVVINAAAMVFIWRIFSVLPALIISGVIVGLSAFIALVLMLAKGIEVTMKEEKMMSVRALEKCLADLSVDSVPAEQTEDDVTSVCDEEAAEL